MEGSPSKTAGSFPIGFTSRMAGAGTTPSGIIGGEGPCPPGGPSGGPPGGPPGGVPGLIGGVVGEGGLDLPFWKVCKVGIG